MSIKALKLMAIMGIATISSVTACSPVAPTAPRPAVVVDAQQTVVADLGNPAGPRIEVNLMPAAESGYHTQAVVHRWVEADIYQYDLTLKSWNGTTYADLSPAVTVSVPRKVNPKSRAVFTNLKQGGKYQVLVTARGNAGGSAATTALNTAPATAGFDFTAGQDVEDSLTANVRVTFDAVAFNGSGSTTIDPPADGSYQNPSTPESGSAQ